MPIKAMEYSIASFVITVCLVKSITSYGENNGSKNGLGQYETINVTVENIGYPRPEYGLSRRKRNFGVTIYKCSRESCEDEICKPEFYEGPSPPPWCRPDKQFKKESKCNWSKSCWNHHSQCTVQSTKCQQQYQDLTNGGSRPQETFNFECFYNENFCYVEQCRGINNCEQKTVISVDQFENDFLNKLPNCNNVDRKGRRKRSLNLYRHIDDKVMPLMRRERAPVSVLALQGYCCEIGERWQGVKVAHVRPIIK